MSLNKVGKNPEKHHLCFFQSFSFYSIMYVNKMEVQSVDQQQTHPEFSDLSA